MGRLSRTELYGALVTGALIVSTGAVSLLIPRDMEWPGPVRCAVELGEYADTTRGLLVGYNYHLLEQFSRTLPDSTVTIHVARDGESYLDSLRNGVVDIVAIPLSEETTDGEFIYSGPVDSISTWAVRKSDTRLLKEIDSWLDSFHNSPGYELTHEIFTRTYDPERRARTGRKYSYLSPYDDLLKAYADSLGWDWRLLCAVVFQESRFKISVRSHRGAEGLMQMMPHTAGRMGAEDLFIPEESIRAGVSYLSMLQKRYTSLTDSLLERQKLTIAAYNAGEGRIKDCINYAKLRGRNPGSWDEITEIIPEMNEEEILQVDTVKLGIFKGRETIAYVDRVFFLFECFKAICP